MNIPSCENCGCGNYYVNGQAKGKVKGYINSTTRQIDEEFTDKMYFVFSETVRCEECNTINKQVFFDTQLGLLRKKES